MVMDSIPPELVGTGLDTLIEFIRPLFSKLSILVGGVFGLYFILILVRVYYERRKVKILEDIRYDLDRMNISKGLPYSRNRHKIIWGLIRWFKSWFFIEKEVEEPKRKKK